MSGEIPEDIFFIPENHDGYMKFLSSGYCDKPLFSGAYES